MGILIDGYNLLNATGVEGVGRGAPLEKARRGLVHALARALTPAEAAGTVVVFDSKFAPPGLPREESMCGITLLYAKDYDEADDLIEELIDIDRDPRRLVVVSGDHRLHRAARRRRATPVDSDVWFAQLERRSRASEPDGRASTGKASPSPEASAAWLAEFADVDVREIHEELRDECSNATPTGATAADAASADAAAANQPPPKEGISPELRDANDGFIRAFTAKRDEGHDEKEGDPSNPFPPGYGEDLLKDEEQP
ncbi:MAG: NYN domain-containing protein [Planctomycetales bacterium]|nr:NYN domain-containing protein [Planctomycetales bacterium]